MSSMEEKNVEEIFAKRLRELRVNAKLTQTEMAKILNMKQQSYLRYELGTGEPSLRTLATLAKHFDVSIDFLLGLTEY